MTPFAGPLLVVSPHPDDAALSCSALLDRGEPVDVLTVFAGAPEPPRRTYWDERCGFADSDEAIRVRRAEETEALSPGGHRLRFLDLVEEQYVERRRDEADARTVAAAVGEVGDALVAAPVGAGRPPGRLLRRHAVPPHPDHVFVRNAVSDAIDGPLLLYEEFPYLRSGRGDAEATRIAARLGRRAELVRVEIDRGAKARRLAAYASQLPFLGGTSERFDRPEVLPRFERYWLLKPS